MKFALEVLWKWPRRDRWLSLGNVRAGFYLIKWAFINIELINCRANDDVKSDIPHIYTKHLWTLRRNNAVYYTMHNDIGGVVDR